jgi:hypothetical protein
MKNKAFTKVASVFFGIVALAHVSRLVLGWQVTVGTAVLPVWMSGLGVVVAGVFAVMLWRESRL